MNAISQVVSTYKTFVPVTDTFNSGSGNEAVPIGSKQIIITSWGGAAGGSLGGVAADSGGGAGAYSQKTLAINPADWGTNIPWIVGSGGVGKSAGSAGIGTNGQDSTIGSVTLTNGTINMVAGKGFASDLNAPGGTATGGDTNTSGGNGTAGTTPTGGASPNGGVGGIGPGNNPGTAPGGGGSGASAMGGTKAGDGASGRITFAWS